MGDSRSLTRQDLTRTLFGAAAFQLLNAGCRLGLFRLLHDEPGLTSEAIGSALRLRRRPTDVLLLGTTALGLTSLAGGGYRNAELLDEMFRDGSWEVLSDIVAFEADIVYEPQADFLASLREDTNVGLRRFAGDEDDLYRRLSNTPALEQLFFRCMRSWSKLSNPILVSKTDLTGVQRVLDVGGGDGINSIALAEANPRVRFTVLDLPGATAIARERISAAGMDDRITVAEFDMFAEPFPTGYDCVLFANQLVIWSPEQNLALLRKAHDALAPGGRVLVFNAMSDEDGPLYAALDNVYFTTLPASASTLYRWDQYESWLTEAGFSGLERLPGGSWTPHGVISGTK
ncbi:methyltransferase [Saccharopolyspora rosea]|uniref:Methyltransferase n=1 Tax=Saccharopolyspora rosea TaxID=524884 RepID=A0ABW3FQA0_9PSEU|nr:methyltransferase [Saccharopolyspora rosea]